MREKRITGRLPIYFELDRYGMSTDDVVRLAMACDAAAIGTSGLITPVWDH